MQMQKQILNPSTSMIDINCDMFIDKGWDSTIDMNICKDYTIEQELYFMALFAVNSTALTLFVNADWFNISNHVLSTNINIQSQSYSECISILDDMSDTFYHCIFPCDIDTESPSSSPTMVPTSIPSDEPSINPTQSPSSLLPTAQSKDSTEADSFMNGAGIIVVLIILSFVILVLVLVIIFKMKSSSATKIVYAAAKQEAEMGMYEVPTMNTTLNAVPSFTAPMVANNGSTRLPGEQQQDHTFV